MNRRILLFFLVIVLACGEGPSSDKRKQGGNHLIHESSPYLLQHAQNPVDWHPWGQEALNKAQSEGKLLLISIGYAACHWCHVMEHESFEDTTIARIMNESFVNIKVDREERPDIDDIYMTACQMANGRGCGWPLNCFALPDGRPVWAGTYFPKKDWSEILAYFRNLYQDDPGKLEEYAQQLTEGIQTMDVIETRDDEFTPSEASLTSITDGFVDRMDLALGGKKGSPKFPMPNGLQFLLRANHYNEGGDQLAKKAAMTTLEKMANGGIYDHLGGGFARYSVDSIWLVPHFEKMLYDNAQLLTTYAEAYKINKKPRFKEVLEETIEFLNRELRDKNGGYYSSLDADSEGEEGKYYVWTEKEISDVLSDQNMKAVFLEYYNIRPEGNWEDEKNILHVTKPIDQISGYQKQETERLLEDARSLLLNHRSQRVRPGLDDKILCAWNALTLKGLVDAYTALGNNDILKDALSTADFMAKAFVKKGSRLDRNYKDGETAINAFLDDYALYADALISLYEVTFDEKHLRLAESLIQYAEEHFYDPGSGFYFYTSDEDPALIARKKELSDNVIPGSNSVMARVLWKMGILTDNQEYQSKAKKMMAATLDASMKPDQVTFYSNWAILFTEILYRPFEIAIVGEESLEKAVTFQSGFHPDALFLGGTSEGTLSLLENKLQEGRTMIYVCQNRVCKFPVESVEEAIKLMK